MAGPQPWDPDDLARLRQVREAFLSDPGCAHGLPEPLSAAWRRALFLGVEPDRDSVPAVPVAPDPPLLAAATPVLDRLAGSLRGTDVSVVLSDAHAHVLGCWPVGERMRAHLERIQTRPGADLSEPVTGNNGISDVLATRRPGLVTGPEHIFGLYQQTVCAGAPVRNPVTRRIDGAIALVCGLDSPPALLDALAQAAVAAIEGELRDRASPRERILVDAYLAAAAGGTPVVVLDGRTRVTSPAAAALLAEADLRQLEDHAAAAAGGTPLAGGPVELGASGCTARLRPVVHAGATCGVVATVHGPAAPAAARPGPPPSAAGRQAPAAALPGLVGSSPAWRRTLQAARLLDPAAAVLVIGEPGAGRTAVALALAAAGGAADTPVVDAALAATDGEGWARDLAAALAAGAGAAVVRHLEALPVAALEAVLALTAAHPQVRVLATCAADQQHAPAVARLRAGWSPALLPVPPLRDRAADLPELARALSLRGCGTPLTFTLEAEQALRHYRWPANVAELASLVGQLTAEHGTARPVGLADLPGHIARCARGRPLSGIESAEYSAIRDALGRHQGNRLRTAQSLGIARATLYRKLRLYGLDRAVPAVRHPR